MGIMTTDCNLTDLIGDYSSAYDIRVQLLSGGSVSNWTVVQRFYPKNSKLHPPSFTILAISSKLVVNIHTKPIMKKLFPFGMTYTIFLDDKEEDNKTTIAELRDNRMKDEGTKTFDSLHWGRQYCVRLRAQGNGALAISNVSHSQCLRLPKQEWYIIATLSSLGLIVVLAVLLTVICCFLTHPEKTPVSLGKEGSCSGTCQTFMR
ncbi:interleukin-10 receptor subunit alpha [Lampris incognitus]|uniref:interleukin-10 receptor subunit alpha n=1 Tax=Lampris incognitus TaxID=2546036 RepID=UPI0024B5C006|nr:interleukin-10 receptor subunit alpha [Lampris incognitus]